ncbi:hypothetical protein HJFPF1_03355 [Paramyrothecium foliicola]|nr:hypothetical protein HJFPF1_03355 [Paramyrothecium foliicola]
MGSDILIDEKDDEKMPFPVVYDPPSFQARPTAERDAMSHSQDGRKRRGKGGKKSKGMAWMDFSVRGRFGSDASRRPLISAPSNFRHVHSSSFRFPAPTEPCEAQFQPTHDASPSSSYRPLELSIHYSGIHHMSPLLPHFEFPRPVATPPPAYLPNGPDVEHELAHQRSYSSSLSFQVPRKQLPDSSPSTVPEDEPPQIPPRAPGRARAHTSPEMDRIKERVASAMLEMERLQQQIDDVMERQSIYVNSRPSTAHSVAHTPHGKLLPCRVPICACVADFDPGLEPMPSIPALPPAAPSFAQRLHSDADRPQTAPLEQSPKPLQQSSDRWQSVEAAATSPRLPPSPGAKMAESPLAPPLPLVLRPPLRKKKSFSRISSWLFPSSDENRDEHFYSITTLPRPIKGHEGFYQCVATDSKPRRLSGDSLTTVSTWYTNEEDPVSPPTACSPESTPVITKQDEGILERTATFGKSVSQSSSRPGVGVAF